MGENCRRETSSEDEHVILMRLLADSDRLCRTTDPLLSGQAAQLRGRILAMIEVAGSEPSRQPEARA